MPGQMRLYYSVTRIGKRQHFGGMEVCYAKLPYCFAFWSTALLVKTAMFIGLVSKVIG